jgi:hypothetical protein
MLPRVCRAKSHWFTLAAVLLLLLVVLLPLARPAIGRLISRMTISISYSRSPLVDDDAILLLSVWI